MSPGFSCVTPVMASFSSKLLQAIISYWAESHLESYQTSMIELFCKNSQQPRCLLFLQKGSIADVRLDSKCATDWKGAVNVRCR